MYAGLPSRLIESGNVAGKPSGYQHSWLCSRLQEPQDAASTLKLVTWVCHLSHKYSEMLTKNSATRNPLCYSAFRGSPCQSLWNSFFALLNKLLQKLRFLAEFLPLRTHELRKLLKKPCLKHKQKIAVMWRPQLHVPWHLWWRAPRRQNWPSLERRWLSNWKAIKSQTFKEFSPWYKCLFPPTGRYRPMAFARGQSIMSSSLFCISCTSYF